MKTIIILAGAGSAGKTSTTQAFAEGIPVETKTQEIVPTQKGERLMSCTWTSYNNCAVAGNHNSGTDYNKGPGVTKVAAFYCLEDSDIIIIDGYTSSPQWVSIANEAFELYANANVNVLFVNYDITLEELVRRMAGRRGCNIADMYDESIGGKIVHNIAAGMRRPGLLLNHYIDKLVDGVPLYILDVFDEDSIDDIVDLIDRELDAIYSACGESYYVEEESC